FYFCILFIVIIIVTITITTIIVIVIIIAIIIIIIIITIVIIIIIIITPPPPSPLLLLPPPICFTRMCIFRARGPWSVGVTTKRFVHYSDEHLQWLGHVCGEICCVYPELALRLVARRYLRGGTVVACRHSIDEYFGPVVRFEISTRQSEEVDEEKQAIYNSTIAYFKDKYKISSIKVIRLLIGGKVATSKFVVDIFRTLVIPKHPVLTLNYLQKPESDANNGRVHYRDAAAKFTLPTGPVVCAAQHHDSNKGPPDGVASAVSLAASVRISRTQFTWPNPLSKLNVPTPVLIPTSSIRKFHSEILHDQSPQLVNHLSFWLVDPTSSTNLNVASSSTQMDKNEVRLRALMEERDTLMNTGNYSLDDPVIVKLNQEIRLLLKRSNGIT
ncbi:hypothetical protein ANN_10936, partial [Periplaneta americana]